MDDDKIGKRKKRREDQCQKIVEDVVVS